MDAQHTVCNFKTVCGCVKNWIKYLRRRLINLLKKVNKGIWMEARGASARVSHHSVGVSLDLRPSLELLLQFRSPLHL